MARYKYHDDWLLSAQWDCNFWVKCSTLEEVRLAEPKRDRNPHFSVHADCEHAGFATVANVGLNLYETDGKSLDAIYDLLDKEIDEYIACRVKTGHWGRRDM